MDYYQKYLKYKLKYSQLKNTIGGTYPVCKLERFFDLDCVIPNTTDKTNDFIFNNRLSKQTVDLVRGSIQNYYHLFYKYLVNPKLSELELKNSLYSTNNSRIRIPIFVSRDKPTLGKYNKELLIIKFKNNDAVEYLRLCKERYETEEQLEKQKKITEEQGKIQEKQVNIYNDAVRKLKEQGDILEKQRNKVNEQVKTFNDQVIKLNKEINNYEREKRKFDEEKNKLDEEQKKYEDLNKIYRSENTKINEYIIKLNEEKKKYITEYDKYNELLRKQSDILIRLKKYQDIFAMLSYEDNINFSNTPEKIIVTALENTNKKLISIIKDNLNNNNCDQIGISLNFFDTTEKNMNTIFEGHANNVLIFKFKKGTKDTYLCLRTEPHRHTNVYCRNSVRKAIRDIFKNLENSYYQDYVISSHFGLQTDESKEAVEIEKANISDFDSLTLDLKKLSPLQGNSGFCASWTMYTTFIVLTNKDKGLDEIGEYLTTFNKENYTTSTLDRLVAEFNKCIQPPGTIQGCVRSKEEFAKNVIKYSDLKKTGSYIIPPESKDITYILLKHIKLYRMIFYILYFITRVIKETDIVDTIKGNNINDYNILNKLFDKIEQLDNNSVKNQLLKQQSIQLAVSDNIIDKDTHLCDDSLFDHNEFCLDDDSSKKIPVPDNLNCKNNKLNKDGMIVLKGIKTTEEDESKNNREKVKKIANYVFNNYKSLLN